MKDSVPPRWRFAEDESWEGAPQWDGEAPPARERPLDEDHQEALEIEAARNQQAQIDLAWLRLLLIHTPFRAADQAEYRGLINALRDIEGVFLADEGLSPYYQECFARPSTVVPGMSPRRPVAGGAEWKLAHVVMLQAQLMEDVFYMLALERHANAPDNRGWMNLFRRWGNSPTFLEHFEAIRGTFTNDFVDFVDIYVRGLGPIDCLPVPHPWDPRGRRKDPRPPFTPKPECELPGRPTPSPRPRYIPGVYLDSGIREAEPSKPPSLTPEPYAHGSTPSNPVAGSTGQDGGPSGDGGGTGTTKTPE
jgi:hypothetical protein